MQKAHSTTLTLNENIFHQALAKVAFFGKSLGIIDRWSIDSRTIQVGDFFVALKGERVDGHDFVKDAFERGAVACMIEQRSWDIAAESLRPWLAERSVIVVPSTHDALLTLAAWWRSQFSYPVIGVTGSVGKTTTKELIATLLRAHGAHVLASTGTHNTCISLALHMMRMRPEHTHALFEMGISRRGEMQALTRLVRPTTAIITALGHSHMEGLGTLADIAAEKRAIFEHLGPDGVGIICDHPLLSMIAYPHPVIRFGCKMTNQIQARQICYDAEGIRFVLKIYGKRFEIKLPTYNISRVYNIVGAVAVAYQCGVDVDTIVRSIALPLEIPGRFSLRSLGEQQHILIDDSYNASPESMKAALMAFDRLEGEYRKIAILGDMLELGVNTDFWHRQMGRFLRRITTLNHIILVGKHMKAAQAVMPYRLSFDVCENWEEAASAVRQHCAQGRVCLLAKGSRSMGLDKVIATLSVELAS